MFSHIGVQGTCPGPRNLSDDMLRLLKANGGVAGIAQFEGAVCEPTFAATAKAILHAIKIAGIDHVALGCRYGRRRHRADGYQRRGVPDRRAEESRLER